jgi:hypothetical protein
MLLAAAAAKKNAPRATRHQHTTNERTNESFRASVGELVVGQLHARFLDSRAERAQSLRVCEATTAQPIDSHNLDPIDFDKHLQELRKEGAAAVD